MNTIAEKLLDLHMSGATIIERGYLTIPHDWFIAAGDADGQVQSWTECFPGVRQKPVIFLEDSTEWLGTLYPGGRYPHQWSVASG